MTHGVHVIELIGNCSCVESLIGGNRKQPERSAVADWGIWRCLVWVVPTTVWKELETKHDMTETSNLHPDGGGRGGASVWWRRWKRNCDLLPMATISQLDEASISQQCFCPTANLKPLKLPRSCQTWPHLFKSRSGSDCSCSVESLWKPSWMSACFQNHRGHKAELLVKLVSRNSEKRLGVNIKTDEIVK